MCFKIRLKDKEIVAVLTRQAEALERLASTQETQSKLLEILVSLMQHDNFTVEGGDFMFVVKDDEPAHRFRISKVTRKDSEGHVIPDESFEYDCESTDPDAVAVTLDDTPEEGFALSGEVSFGAPGLANVNATAKLNGDIVSAKSAAFTVTTGDPASIEGGDIEFDGLTEV